jgi:predicted acetyltransferase
MSIIKLIEPDISYANDIWEFRNEILNYDSGNKNRFAGCRCLHRCKSPEEWINTCKLLKSDDTYSQTGLAVPSNVYLAIRKSDNLIIGIIDLRHHIDNPTLGTYGGHCGYSVRPSERGNGYAKEMLLLNIRNAKKLGIKKLLVTCDSTNIASEKTIISCGGLYEKTVKVCDYYIKRYWICVP